MTWYSDRMVPDWGWGIEVPRDGRPYPLLRHVLSLRPSGVAVEFGVGTGTSTRLIADQMPVTGFDSFEGLDVDWRPDFPKGSLSFHAPRIPNATLVKGWFTDTLPTHTFDEPVGLVHFDADTYSATTTALQYVGHLLKEGTYVVFDEFFDYDDGPGMSWRDHEYKAWREFVESTDIDWTVTGHAEEGWAIRIT